MIQEAVKEEVKGLREEIKQLKDLIATERINGNQAAKILGFRDYRTAKNHLERAGIYPKYDENGNIKYIKQEIVDYAHDKNFKITSD